MATITPYITGMEDGASYDGSTCVRDYLVDGIINAGDLPVIGQPYSSQPDWPGSNFVVTSYGRVASVRQPTGGGVTFDVMRVNGSTSGTVMVVGGTLINQIEKGMEAGEGFQVSPEHIGARQADGHDCGEWEDPETKQVFPHALTQSIPVGTGPYDATPATPIQAKYLLYTPLPAANTYAYRGCYVYATAKPAVGYGSASWEVAETVPKPGGALGYNTVYVKKTRRFFYAARTATSGAASVEHCPFVINGAPTTTELNLYMIGRSYICQTYQVAFYRRTDQYYMTNAPQYPNNGRVTDWGPVSGKKYGPPVASGSPATNGQWRITAQSVTGMRDNDGVDVLKIVRTFQRVPYAFSSCIWNPNIYPVWSADWT
jgi:hypothetical protein